MTEGGDNMTGTLLSLSLLNKYKTLSCVTEIINLFSVT